MQKEKAICCKIEGCQSKGIMNPNGTEVFSKGYCNKHYLRLKRHGNPLYELQNVIYCKIECFSK